MLKRNSLYSRRHAISAVIINKRKTGGKSGVRLLGCRDSAALNHTPLCCACTVPSRENPEGDAIYLLI